MGEIGKADESGGVGKVFKADESSEEGEIGEIGEMDEGGENVETLILERLAMGLFLACAVRVAMVDAA